MDRTSSSNTQYLFLENADVLAAEMLERLNQWRGIVNRNGLQRKWWKSYRLYYGKHFFKDLSYQDSEIIRTGDKGELSAVAVNHYRSFIRHILSLTTNQKPSFDARAINSEAKSLDQAKLANQILDAYLREKRLGRYLETAAEHALVFGKGFIFPQWDPQAGEAYSKEESIGPDGQPSSRTVYQGDIDLRCPSILDVYVDPSAEDFRHIYWANVRTFDNKWELAAKYPAMAEKIISLPTKAEMDGVKYFTFQVFNDSTDVPVYYAMHKKSKVLPNGRLVVYCATDCVLYDGPLPYKTLPLFRIVPGEIFGTTEGYTDAFDLMGLNEAYNTLFSTAFTNQQANGVQKIWMPEGGNLTAQQVSKGLALLRGPAGKQPIPLQLTATAQEIFQFMPMIESAMEKLSGINNVVRGDSGENLKSGVALGLMQSMAVQYTSMFQRSWAELLEDTGTFILDLLKTFATSERMIAIAGKNHRAQLKSFKSDDLSNVDRVVVELGNAMSRSAAGRMQIADNLLEKGLIKTPQEYITVMETGQLEPMTDGISSQLSLIHGENDKMAQGIPTQAMVGDAHLLHCQKHMELIDNPDVRDNAEFLAVLLAHVQSHKMFYETQDPFFSLISGEPPAPQLGMPPMDQGVQPQGQGEKQGRSPSAPPKQQAPVAPDSMGLSGQDVPMPKSATPIPK
jgi:hypothetical protein